MNSYQPLPVAFEYGVGAWLFNAEGQRYLDALSGIAVCGLGHAHPVVERAIADQAGKLLHTSNIYHIPLQRKLAEQLTGLSGMERAFFSNSGAEANETAIKISRLWGRQRAIDNPVVIVAKGGFHGRTMATLSATGNTKVQQGFEPLVECFLQVPYNNLQALREACNEQVVAIMLEPIQGEGGVIVPQSGYLKGVRQICDENGYLLILDEVQTGMCRCGEWFAFQHEQILPDVVTLAKALGNGVPIGACLARGEAAELIQPGKHGSTFGGNPLAARAALAVIEVLTERRLWKRSAELGKRMLQMFEDELANISGVVSIRGKGLMLGIELERECQQLVKMALAEHLLLNVTAGRVVRFLPPLILSNDEAEQIVDRSSALIKGFLR